MQKRRHHMSLSMAYKVEKDSFETERRNKMLLKKLTDIGLSKSKGDLKMKRVSVPLSIDLGRIGYHSYEYKLYPAATPLQMAVPIQRKGPTTLNYISRKKEHERIMRENLSLANRITVQRSSLSPGRLTNHSRDQKLRKMLKKFPPPRRPSPELGVSGICSASINDFSESP
jgi:hypothetical protein